MPNKNKFNLISRYNLINYQKYQTLHICMYNPQVDNVTIDQLVTTEILYVIVINKRMAISTIDFFLYRV